MAITDGLAQSVLASVVDTLAAVVSDLRRTRFDVPLIRVSNLRPSSYERTDRQPSWDADVTVHVVGKESDYGADALLTHHAFSPVSVVVTRAPRDGGCEYARSTHHHLSAEYERRECCLLQALKLAGPVAKRHRD
jgi:hypothetical protein